MLSAPSEASRMLEFVKILIWVKQSLLLILLLLIETFLFFLLRAVSVVTTPTLPLISLHLLLPLILVLPFLRFLVHFPSFELIVGLEVGFGVFFPHPPLIFQTSLVLFFIIL